MARPWPVYVVDHDGRGGLKFGSTPHRRFACSVELDGRLFGWSQGSKSAYTQRRMTQRPRIAIPVPTSFDPAYNLQSWPEYARAVEESGGDPIRVELNAGSHLLDRFDGILLPGSGADVAPSLYGQEIAPETAPADAPRQGTDTELLWQAQNLGIPLLGICFGMQSLNVHRGGTLIQHLAPMPVNHRAGRAVHEAHAVIIQQGSRLASLAGSDATERRMVNTSHHQAIHAAGSGLTIVARSAEDRVIEAVEDVQHPWLLGVQWHPERTLENPLSRAIFDSFISAASASDGR